MDITKTLFYGWIIVIAGFLINMAWGIEYTYGVFFKPMAYEFGWSRTATSFAYSIFTVVSSVSTVFMGGMTDKYGPRLTIVSGSLLCGLGMVLSYWVNSLWHLYLVFGFVVGFGISSFYIASVSTTTRWFEGKRGLALGIVASGVGVGGSMFPPLIGYIISIYGWRMAFAVFGLIILVLTVPTGFMMKHNPKEMGLRAYGERSATMSKPSQNGWTVAGALKTSQFWILYLIHICACVVLTLIFVHFVPLLTDIGFSMTIAASAFGLVGGCSIIGRVGMGSVSDRIGRKYTLIICFVIQAVVILCLMGVRNTWMVYAFAVLFGISYGGWVPQFPAIIEEFFGARSLSTILALILTGYGVGGIIGPTIGGYSFDVSGSYFLAFSIGVVSCILAVVLGFLTRPPQLKTP
ncbi:MAG: MFS transporter [Candidatus Geothermarchaeales archaeon]